MLPHKDMNLLMKLCGMLGSSHDGERAAAANRATELLKRNKLTWADFFKQMVNGAYLSAPTTAAAMPQPKRQRTVRRRKYERGTDEQWTTWRSNIEFCRSKSIYLTMWDRANLDEMEAKLHAGYVITHTHEQRLLKMVRKIKGNWP